MASKKNTRRALFMSIMSLILCCAMLMGTTFAWFTDAVKSGRNQIAAGNLDVELYSGEVKVTENTVLFDDVYPTLWEPGAVAFENLQVKNEGTLALKYDFNLSVLNETEVNGHRLSEVIMVGIVDGGVNGTDRDTVVSEVNTWTPLNKFNMNMSGEKLKADQASPVFGVVLYWQPNSNEIDNLYNMNNTNSEAGNVLQLDIGVELLATQQMHENDSFGDDYDANAPYDSWDGTVPTEMPETLVVDGETQTIHVKDAAAFMYLSTLSNKWAELYTDGNGREYTNYANGAGGNYYYSGQWTVSLESNIDLNNQNIAPISIVIGEKTGASAFNGNGHVIRNINTTTGLFADDNRVTYSNFALDNVKATNGAVTGSVDNDITNITVNNATISGVEYVGGLVGYTYGEVINCKVMNSSVTATGKEAGGLIGYVATSDESAEVYNNEVYNVSVHADNRAAGLIGQANIKVKVHNNTIDTVTVSAEDHEDYKPDAVVSSALAPENVYNNTVKNAKVLEGETAMHPDSGLIWNGESTNHKGVYSIYSADDLKKAVSYFAGQDHSNEGNKVTFELMADIDMAGKTWEPWDVMWINFKGNNHKISNITISGWRTGFFGYVGASNITDLTLENVVSKGAQAGTFAGSVESVTFTNCHLTGSNSVSYVPYSSADYTETYNGIGAVTGVVSNSTINVTIDNGATVTLNRGQMFTDEGCTYINDLTGHITTNKGTVTNNGTVTATGNILVQEADGLYKDPSTSANDWFVANANGLAALNTKMSNGSAGKTAIVNLIDDIDFTGKTWTPVDSHADSPFFMNEINGNDHTISNMTINGQAMFTRFAGFGDVTIKDITFDNATVNSTDINTSVLTVQSYQNVLLDNVDVKNSTITGTYKVAPLMGTVYNESSSTVKATLKNCDVSDVTVKATSRDFCTTGMVAFVYEGNNDRIEFENCTVTNVKLMAKPGGYAAHAWIYVNDADTDDRFDKAEGVTVKNCTFEALS